MERTKSRSQPTIMTSRRQRLPLFLSGLFLLSQAFPLISLVRDAATLQRTEGFRIVYPFWHILFTPFCGVADALTVLGYHQILVTVGWFIVISFLMGGVRKGFKHTIFFFGFAACVVLVPRPMAKLVASDPAVLLIDFHSHSQISHDGRSSFTPELNMHWHQDQGYNAAFITDHNRTEASMWAKEDSRRSWKTKGYRS